jgi:RNA polymerase sigma-70 factor, ECF subfamily
MPGERTPNEILTLWEPRGVGQTVASVPVQREHEAVAPRSYEALYREHHDFVWRNARRLGCEDDWVEDAVHETFLVAIRRLPEFEGRSSIRTWLFAIALRVIQRMKRDRARYRLRVTRYSEARACEGTPNLEDQSEAARYLRELLGRLDDAKRLVVILIELEGMTSAEAAQALGAKQGTVDSRLRAARIELAKMIRCDRERAERTTR